MPAIVLSDEQLAAINSRSPRVCILACAGSGKTTTLTQRIARIIDEDGVPPSKVAAITFTVLAGDKLKFELSQVTKNRASAALMFVGTIHSFCLRVLQDEHVVAGEGIQPITESQQFVLLTKQWQSWNLQAVSPTLRKTDLIERLIGTIDVVKMNDVPADDLEKTHPEFIRVFRLYEAYLKKRGFIDFADMLVTVRNLLRDDPAARARCVSRYRYVFVDEYQDVDPIQAEILGFFLQYAQVCVVGDDDQAIYQFRGADERNIQDLATLRGVVTKHLSENRRCPVNILTVAEANVKKLSRRLPKSMTTRVDCGLVSVERFSSVGDECTFISDTIKDLRESGQITSYSQVGILFRSLSTYGSQYLDALKGAGIPYVARGARTLFESEEIAKMAAAIEWLAKDSDIADHIPFLAPIFTPDLDCERLRALGKSLHAIDAREFADAGAGINDWELAQSLLRIRADEERRIFRSLLELTHRLVEVLGLLAPDMADASKYNVAQFTRIVADYENIQDNRSVASFAGYLVAYASTAFDEVRAPESRANAVSVLTVHQAKGLEFDFVFIPMLVNQRFPLDGRQRDWLIEDSLFDSSRYLTSIDSERRLFYVACTRARKSLYLLSSVDVGLQHPKTPSKFWEEARNTPLPAENKTPNRPPLLLESDRYLVTGYSALEYYLTCPYRYQIIVEYGLEVPQTIFFQFGKLVHDVLAHVNRSALAGSLLPIDDAKRYYRDVFPLYYKNTTVRAYDMRSQQLRGESAIEQYYRHRDDWISNISGIEGDLAYPMPRALIRGRYDALLRNERGNYTVIDFKTGQFHADLRTDFQVQFYCLAIREQHQLDVDEAILYYVEGDQTKRFSATPEFLERGEGNLAETVDGILSRRFDARPETAICVQCEVRRLCPYKA